MISINETSFSISEGHNSRKTQSTKMGGQQIPDEEVFQEISRTKTKSTSASGLMNMNTRRREKGNHLTYLNNYNREAENIQPQTPKLANAVVNHEDELDRIKKRQREKILTRLGKQFDNNDEHHFSSSLSKPEKGRIKTDLVSYIQDKPDIVSRTRESFHRVSKNFESRSPSNKNDTDNLGYESPKTFKK